MVFKRRDRRPYWKIAVDFFWPVGGWARAFHYVKHRLRRLPDTPETIARGIFAGVVTVFTPFYGLHFLTAAIIAKVLRGNILASLLATFVGNPLTYVPIGLLSIQTGYFLLGRPKPPDGEVKRSFGGKFLDAARDLRDNLLALVTDRDADWHGLSVFYHEIFFPYLVGGLIPGVVSGLVAYYVSVPLIRAYQARRRVALARKVAAAKARQARLEQGK
ncbi:DUF2062 domain-containing protein [Pseudooceanicola aestuarii]|uniref:DUF2062 domain-containing protein n=1 Tax=Pseudooceanicola aestuarii TaxID=2697319 RepID=UPI0013D270A4|nr:DUF2062 domain-containing protein [Pseudooceanicola aestuarii]